MELEAPVVTVPLENTVLVRCYHGEPGQVLVCISAGLPCLQGPLGCMNLVLFSGFTGLMLAQASLIIRKAQLR